MATTNLEVIIDGDGHIQEDNEAISALMPSFYKENDALRFSLFPPLDHLHSAHAVVTSGQRARKGARVGPEGRAGGPGRVVCLSTRRGH